MQSPAHRRSAYRLRPTAIVRTVPTDRDPYAMLWGPTPALRRRKELIELKRRAALVALLGSFVLALFMLMGALA
jgi:hypothetical protein